MSKEMAGFDKSTNMYGFTRCPECGSHYRCSFANKADVVCCDDCGHKEYVNENNHPSGTE